MESFRQRAPWFQGSRFGVGERWVPGGHILLAPVGEDTDGKGTEKPPQIVGPRAGPVAELLLEPSLSVRRVQVLSP